MESDKILYPAYAGLGRTAMMWGIPLMPFIAVIAVSALVALLCGFILGPGGFLVAGAGVPVLLFFKHICETDDQALRIVGLEAMCVFARANAGLFGRTYTLAPMKYGRSLRSYMGAFDRSPSLVMFEQFRQQLRERLLAGQEEC